MEGRDVVDVVRDPGELEALAPAEIFGLEPRAGLEPWVTLQRLRGAFRAGDAGEAHACFYLADIADRRLWKTAYGHPNLRHFAKHRLGKGYSTVKEYVRVGRELRARPHVRAALESGRICYTTAQHLTGIVVEETEEDWVAWSLQRDSDEVLAAKRRRKKGDRPTDPERRRIHEPSFRVVLELTPTEYTEWERHRQKAEAELGVELSDKELVLMGVRRALCEEVEPGPGRRRVSAKHYLIVAREVPGEPDVLVTEGADGEPREISRRELERTLPAPERVARAPGAPARAEVVYGETSALDPRNNGALAPAEARDAPTSAALREEVLLRDRFRCLGCGARRNLAAHHVHWRRYGGRTELGNLATLCEDCHSLVHVRLMVALGDATSGLRFLDPRGRPYRREAEPPGRSPGPLKREAGEARAAPVEREGRERRLEIGSLPEVVDAAWLARHVDLFSWNERQGVLELTPGWVREAGPEPPRAPGGPATVRLGQLVGQRRTRERLRVAVEVARARGEQVGHLLLSGGPGLGKSTLAEAVAGEMQTRVTRLPAPLVKSPEVLLRALTSLEAGQVLFMDELQAIPPRLAEVLYEALDGGGLSLPVRQGLQQTTLRVRLPAFTFVGATTEEELLPAALRSRLRRERLRRYPEEELVELLLQAAGSEWVLSPGGAARLARVARGTPREALALLRAARDEATLRGTTTVDERVVEGALARLEIDARGLGPLDRGYLECLERVGGPVSLRSLAAELESTEAYLRTVVEPYLQRLGLVRVTARGRVPCGAALN